MITRLLKKLFLKIDIHPATLLYLLLAILGGYIKWYLFALMIVCFHETCHLLMACYFRFQIDHIEILPFGAYLSIEDFYFHSILEELCVVLAGPCSHLLIGYMITFVESHVFYEYLSSLNQTLFFFNLLPIYPLDGGRVIGLLLQSVMDLKKSLYFHLKLSVFAFCCLTVFYLRINTIVVISYLFIQQVHYYRFIPDNLRKYYSQLNIEHEHKKIVIHNNLEYRRNCINYYMKNGKIIHEKDMIFDLLRNI